MEEQAQNITDIDALVDGVALVERTSAKTGRPYKLLQLKLSNGYDVEVFLERAEVKLIELLAKSTPAK
jgi:hypothetical protein